MFLDFFHCQTVVVKKKMCASLSFVYSAGVRREKGEVRRKNTLERDQVFDDENIMRKKGGKYTYDRGRMYVCAASESE